MSGCGNLLYLFKIYIYIVCGLVEWKDLYKCMLYNYFIVLCLIVIDFIFKKILFIIDNIKIKKYKNDKKIFL